jgi:hypothetical protein
MHASKRPAANGSAVASARTTATWIELDAHHPAAAAGRKKSRRTSQAGTDVKNAGAGRNTGAARQLVDGGQATIVVLIVREQVVGGQRGVEAAARAPHGVEHLALADGMTVVELDDLHASSVEAPGLP